MVACLLSAHIITSDVTRAARTPVVEGLQQLLAPLVGPGPVQLVTEHECAEVQERLRAAGGEASAGSSIVQLDPKALPKDDPMRAMLRPMHLRSLSNALKHYAALQAAARAAADVPSCSADVAPPPRRWSLVVEDDALLDRDHAVAMLRRVTENAPEGVDVIFLGMPSSTEASRKAAASPAGIGFEDVTEPLGASRVLPAVDSYLVSDRAARALADAFLPVRFPTHLHVTHLLRCLLQQQAESGGGHGGGGCIGRVASSIPNVFADGSKLGLFVSTLDPNNQLLWSQPYCALASMIGEAAASKEPAAEAADARFRQLWDEQPEAFREHPDARVLMADWDNLTGRPRQAIEGYEKALESFNRDGAPINSSSAFLRRFINTYARVQ